jgi:nucleotide-binding universal stress UspA family protein
MFETIVVGVDGRDGGRDALAFARLLQHTFGSTLIAVGAYPHDGFAGRPSSPAFESAVHEELAHAVVDDISHPGIDARLLLAPDHSPARALHRIAEEQGAGLIVVGSDRRGPLGRVLAGDVTAGTLDGSPCPVAVAPRGLAEADPRLRTIGVGYDGSPEATEALELARTLAEHASASLELIEALPPFVPVGPWMVATISAHDSQRDERRRLEAIVSEAAEHAREGATVLTVEGLPDTVLAQRSTDLDLVVVGSRGYGPVKRLVLGGTSRRLVRRAACPVIVVPRGDDAAHPEPPMVGAVSAS